MEEAAELVAASYLAGGRSGDCAGRIRRPQAACAVRALGVVVLDVDAEHSFNVVAVEDQEPVEAIGADGANEAFRDGARLWRSNRSAQYPGLFTAEDQDFVEAAVYLLSRSRLLRDPDAGRIGRPAGEPDGACCRAR